jgi:hypothetical protein
MQFDIGEVVEVRPSRAGERVQAHPEKFGVMLPDEWSEATWSVWLLRRFMDGSIEVRRPTAAREE